MMSKNYPFTDEEFAQLEAGCRVIPHSYSALTHGVSENCHRLLRAIILELKEPSTPAGLDTKFDERQLITRIATALEFIRSDISLYKEIGESVSDTYGEDLLLRVGAKLVLKSSTAALIDATELPTLFDHVVSSVVCLFLMGRVSQGYRLIRLANTLSTLSVPNVLRNDALVRKGRCKKVSSLERCLNLLRLVDSYLVRFQIPTKGFLQEHYGDWDEGLVSRLIKDAGLQNLLPNLGKGDQSPNLYTVPNWHKDLNESVADVVEFGSLDQNAPTTRAGKVSQQLTAGYVHHNVRLLRERLGAAYPMFLLLFSMESIESQDGLREFEKNLKGLGIALDWREILR